MFCLLKGRRSRGQDFRFQFGSKQAMLKSYCSTRLCFLDSQDTLRVSFVGELGWELHIPRESCEALYKAIHQVGQHYGLVNAGYRAIDSLSIEKGYPHWHQEVGFTLTKE